MQSDGRVTVGLEREGLRITPQGVLASTPHPSVYGDKLDNPYITVDYAEQQIELITPPTRAGIDFIYDLALAVARIVQMQCREDGELFWPASLPPSGIDYEDIQIARYRDDELGRAARIYRENLAARYGHRKQLLSGVHYNISLEGADDEVYLRIARNLARYGWFLIYALGAAPDPTDPFSISVRQGSAGYHNETELFASYESIEAYCESLDRFVADGHLSEAKEFYAPLRFKSSRSDFMYDALCEEGVHYIEIRVLDIDPFNEAGISRESLELLECFVRFLAAHECCEGNISNACDEACQREGAYNMRLVADRGLDPDLMLTIKGQQVALADEVVRMQQLLGIEQPVEPLAQRVHQLIQAQGADDATDGFDNAMLDLARQHQQRAHETRWLLLGFEDWELSTQILMKEAVKRGLQVEPIDAGDNLIRITRTWHDMPEHSEYVMQATRTSADTYISPLLMNNKTVTKRILDEQGIRVPHGEECTRDDYHDKLTAWVDIPAVIKPKSTNFGIAVTIFAQGATLNQLLEAAEVAFEHDDVILVETYIPGTEYRFLVIDGEVLGVLHRKPANVVGDGISTIEQLVACKNEHPYRSKGYRMPLISIDIDEAVIEFIERSGYTPQSVPPKGETVFLRPNSNISTGGDSIDVTDEVDSYFKQIAVDAAHAFDATFCGVDLIIEDITDPESPYAVIEVNWNPAIHIHSFPETGTERSIAPAVLRAIGFDVNA